MSLIRYLAAYLPAASGGSAGEFVATVGNADATGGTSTFTGAAEFVTVVATADAVGGVSSFAGAGEFTTAAGNADAAGGVSSMGVIAVFDTVVGAATAEGGSSAMTGAADFATVVGTATAAGGVGSMEGDPTPVSFDTIAGEAWALGGVSSFDVAVIRYIFRPPAVRLGPAGEGRLFSFYKRAHGICLMVTGSTVTERMVPSTDELDAADAYYLGGHEYDIGAPEASVLIGAGYGALLAPTPDIYTDEYAESY